MFFADIVCQHAAVSAAVNAAPCPAAIKEFILLSLFCVLCSGGDNFSFASVLVAAPGVVVAQLAFLCASRAERAVLF